MTSADGQMCDIEQLERWFADASVDPPGPSVPCLKERVRIEIDERWLEAQLHDEVPVDLADRIARRVWATLAADQDQGTGRTDAVGRTRHVDHVYRWIGAAATVAACLIAFVGLHQGRPGDAGLSFVTAFEQYQEDDLADSISQLDEELAELELGFETVAGFEREDSSYDELLDAIDALMLSDDLENDWS